jgi:O-antigen ligase
MIVAFVALTVVPLSMTKLTPARMAAALATLTLTGVLAAVYVPENVVERLASTQSDVQSLSFGGRFNLWVAGLHAFTFTPLMGYGTGGFIGAIDPQLGDQSLVAHNSFISVLVEEGIIGLILYCTMLYAAVSAVMKLPRRERRFGQILMASLLLAMSPLMWEDRKPVWIILGIVIGLSQVAVMYRRAAAAAQPVAVARTVRSLAHGEAPDAHPSSRAPR